ncbi:PfkB domain protein [Xylanimonas cellulosilytica DSM 15894]|uniref:PfkB domain protein n=1 Tax=Xylanimonas cellulosilytica (strain DSM 15894 / JCM 12276 / CECT 5975 / KCTC 9989 / LMG 20990 / NBRC 107835 / XIL07) TaxID=446471 RepID=D1BYW5_XYLCX|nr:PfkB family carbohydrate kinase [Xylanimonas cellulosilytica]ACZ30040.1 PfkB domain protein [Xylanimonas cellulosilytica DSM 15894]
MTVIVCGPASWNHLILLDRLPEPVPHMQFATASVRTVGGTSAGKAVHLTGLGVETVLHAQLGDDDEGVHVGRALERAGVTVVRHRSAATEQHVNLMTDAGERVSLYVAVPSEPDETVVAAAEAHLDVAEIAVIDLCTLGARLLERRTSGGSAWTAPVWTDLHDYDGASAFHEPFLRAADVVFMNDDAVDDPWELLAGCVARGPRLAVCTRGAAGAMAMDAGGARYEVAAVPTEVVDTNGAGDAFFAGFLVARLRGSGVTGCLTAAAGHAGVALRSTALHPSLH